MNETISQNGLVHGIYTKRMAWFRREAFAKYSRFTFYEISIQKEIESDTRMSTRLLWDKYQVVYTHHTHTHAHIHHFVSLYIWDESYEKVFMPSSTSFWRFHRETSICNSSAITLHHLHFGILHSDVAVVVVVVHSRYIYAQHKYIITIRILTLALLFIEKIEKWIFL